MCSSSELHSTITYLAENGFSVVCKVCKVPPRLSEAQATGSDVEGAPMGSHRSWCIHKKRGPVSSPQVPLLEEEDRDNQRRSPVEEEEGRLIQHQRDIPNRNATATQEDFYPVVDLRAQEVHLATETYSGDIPQDRTMEAPFATGFHEAGPEVPAGREIRIVPSPAGVQPEEQDGTSQLCLL